MNDALQLDRLRSALIVAGRELVTTLLEALPQVLATLIVLVVGWLIARALSAVTASALRRLGLDRAAARVGAVAALARAGVTKVPSRLVGRALFWLLIVVSVLSAAEVLGLGSAGATVSHVAGYLPRLLGAGLVVFVGSLAARLFGGVVVSAAGAAGVSSSARLGTAARLGALAVAWVVALEQLGVQTGILIAPVTAVLATVTLSAGLLIALGARPVVGHIIAGHFLKRSLERDGFVEIDGRRGVVERVRAIDTVFVNGDERWSIPNLTLLDKVVGR